MAAEAKGGPLKTLSRVLLVILVLLLLSSAYLGIRDGVGLVREAHLVFEILATATELLYGVAAVAALAALGARHRSALVFLVIWAAALTATSGLAPVVWAHTSVASGVGSAALVGVIVAALLWGWRRSSAARAGA